MADDAPVSIDAAGGPDAVQVLREDHRSIRSLFTEVVTAASGGASAADRQGLVARLGARLRAHARIEEEILLPALRDAKTDPTLLDEIEIDHADVLFKLKMLAGTDPQDPSFDARLAELADAVNEHLQQEEHELFPVASADDIDAAGVGEKLAQRRGALLGDQGVD